MKRESWFLYILQCKDGSLYTGITLELERRLAQHNAGKASRYTRSRLPVRMVYHEACEDRSHALRRECAVKALTLKEKLRLVEDMVPEPRKPFISFDIL